MSLYLLKRKADRNRRQREFNASNGGFVLNTSNSGRFQTNCSTNLKKTPAPQKSFSQYQRTNLRRAVGKTDTFKQMPNFADSTHMDNVKSRAIRCSESDADLKLDSNGNLTGNCKTIQPAKCFNDSGKKKDVIITKDLGYLTAHEQMEKRKALRVNSGKYESNIVGNTKCSGT